MGDDRQTPAVQPTAVATQKAKTREAISLAVQHGILVTLIWLFYLKIVFKYAVFAEFSTELDLYPMLVFSISRAVKFLWFLGPLFIVGTGVIDGLACRKMGMRYGWRGIRAWDTIVVCFLIAVFIGTLWGMIQPLLHIGMITMGR